MEAVNAMLLHEFLKVLAARKNLMPTKLRSTRRGLNPDVDFDCHGADSDCLESTYLSKQQSKTILGAGLAF
jgi:hypothetical protein